MAVCGVSEVRMPSAKPSETYRKLAAATAISSVRNFTLAREKNPKLTFSGCFCANARSAAKRIGGKNVAFRATANLFAITPAAVPDNPRR